MNKRQQKKYFKSKKLNILQVIYNHVKDFSDVNIFRKFTMLCILKESKLTWGYKEKFDNKWFLDFKYKGNNIWVNSNLEIMSGNLRDDFLYIKEKMK